MHKSRIQSVMLCVAVLLLSRAARAEETLLWELRPYRIDVRIAADAAPVWTERRLAELVADVRSRVRSAYGTSWTTDVAIVEDAAGRRRLQETLADNDPSSGSELGQQLGAAEQDKLILVTLSQSSNAACTVAAREWDRFTRVWGPTIRREFEQPALADRAVFGSVAAAFSPLGLVTRAKDGEFTFRARAAQLNARSGEPFPVGSAARLVLRRPAEAGTPIDETFLRVSGIEGGSVTARLVSRFRQPLDPGEYVALGIATPPGETDVQIVRAGDRRPPLIGLDVFALEDDDQPLEYLGRTDQAGRIRVAAGRSTLRTVVVQSGGQTLAELPIVPGWRDKLTVDVVLDDDSVPALGAMAAARARLLDLIVRREIALRRATGQSANGNATEAEKLLDDFRAELTPATARLRKFIEDSKDQARVGDPVQQTRVRQQWDRLLAALEKELDPARVVIGPAGN